MDNNAQPEKSENNSLYSRYIKPHVMKVALGATILYGGAMQYQNSNLTDKVAEQAQQISQYDQKFSSFVASLETKYEARFAKLEAKQTQDTVKPQEILLADATPALNNDYNQKVSEGNISTYDAPEEHLIKPEAPEDVTEISKEISTAAEDNVAKLDELAKTPITLKRENSDSSVGNTNYEKKTNTTVKVPEFVPEVPTTVAKTETVETPYANPIGPTMDGTPLGTPAEVKTEYTPEQMQTAWKSMKNSYVVSLAQDLWGMGNEFVVSLAQSYTGKTAKANEMSTTPSTDKDMPGPELGDYSTAKAVPAKKDSLDDVLAESIKVTNFEENGKTPVKSGNGKTPDQEIYGPKKTETPTVTVKTPIVAKGGYDPVDFGQFLTKHGEGAEAMSHLRNHRESAAHKEAYKQNGAMFGPFLEGVKDSIPMVERMRKHTSQQGSPQANNLASLKYIGERFDAKAHYVIPAGKGYILASNISGNMNINVVEGEMKGRWMGRHRTGDQAFWDYWEELNEINPKAAQNMRMQKFGVQIGGTGSHHVDMDDKAVRVTLEELMDLSDGDNKVSSALAQKLSDGGMSSDHILSTINSAHGVKPFGLWKAIKSRGKAQNTIIGDGRWIGEKGVGLEGFVSYFGKPTSEVHSPLSIERRAQGYAGNNRMSGDMFSLEQLTNPAIFTKWAIRIGAVGLYNMSRGHGSGDGGNSSSSSQSGGNQGAGAGGGSGSGGGAGSGSGGGAGGGGPGGN